MEFSFSEKLHSKGSNDGPEWYVSFIIVVAAIIVALFVAYAVIYCRRRWLGNRKCESSPDVQNTNQDPVYEEIDLKKLAQNRYESPRGVANDGCSNYAELGKAGDAENTYQPLK